MTDGNLGFYYHHSEGIFTIHRLSLARQLFPKSCIPDVLVHMIPTHHLLNDEGIHTIHTTSIASSRLHTCLHPVWGEANSKRRG